MNLDKGTALTLATGIFSGGLVMLLSPYSLVAWEMMGGGLILVLVSLSPLRDWPIPLPKRRKAITVPADWLDLPEIEMTHEEVGPRVWARRLCDHAEWATHHIQNAHVSKPADVAALRESEREWIAKGVEMMNDAGCTAEEISRFRVLGHYQPAGLVGITLQHAKLCNEVAERVDRLRSAAARLEST